MRYENHEHFGNRDKVYTEHGSGLFLSVYSTDERNWPDHTRRYLAQSIDVKTELVSLML